MLTRTMVKGLALSMLAMPGAGWCLGLGDITVDSVLSQPLRAEIKLVSVDPGELDDVRASLATKETFERIGIQRPFVLSKLQFQSRRTSDGHASLEVTTREPMREPFLNFLVEVEWPQGRLLREYTVLLDPPLPIDQRRSASTRALAAVGTPNKPPDMRVARKPVEYTVASGDTLYGIAERHLPDETVTLPQVMLAILRANPSAFAQQNVNNLMTGAVLRIPTGNALVTLDEQAAFAELAQQNALWHDDRAEPGTKSASLGDDQTTDSTKFERPQKQALAVGADTRGQRLTENPPRSMSISIEESQPRLMASGAAGANTEAGGAEEYRDKDALQTEIAVAREISKLPRVEIAALASRLAELESIVTEQERIILLQGKALIEFQQRLDGLAAARNGTVNLGISRSSSREGGAGAAASMANVEQDEGSKNANKQAMETASQSFERVIPTDPDTQLSTLAQAVAPTQPAAAIEAIFASPAMLEGLGAAGILLLALSWLMARRTASRRAWIMREKKVSAMSVNAAPVHLATKQSTDADDDAILTEANVYIPYGLQQQTEDLPQKDVKCSSTSVECCQKLLEVRYTFKNVQGFAGEVHALRQFCAVQPGGIW